MLATLGTIGSLSAAATWRLEGKWDGMRAVAHVDAAGGLVLSAFEELFTVYHGAVFAVVVSVLRDHAQAQEVTQEVFLQVW